MRRRGRAVADKSERISIRSESCFRPPWPQPRDRGNQKKNRRGFNRRKWWDFPEKGDIPAGGLEITAVKGSQDGIQSTTWSMWETKNGGNVLQRFPERARTEQTGGAPAGENTATHKALEKQWGQEPGPKKWFPRDGSNGTQGPSALVTDGGKQDRAWD